VVDGEAIGLRTTARHRIAVRVVVRLGGSGAYLRWLSDGANKCSAFRVMHRWSTPPMNTNRPIGCDSSLSNLIDRRGQLRRIWLSTTVKHQPRSDFPNFASILTNRI
jgi:hypothetical protein